MLGNFSYNKILLLFKRSFILLIVSEIDKSILTKSANSTFRRNLAPIAEVQTQTQTQTQTQLIVHTQTQTQTQIQTQTQTQTQT